MSRLSHELLLALAYASGIGDPKALRERFFESLAEIDPSRAFEFSALEPRPEPGLEILPLETPRSLFGYALIRTRPGADRGSPQDPEKAAEPALLRTAFQFLAVILENRAQALALESEKASLEGEVASRRAEIVEQEERYRNIFENRHVAMLLLDAQGLIVDASPASLEFYGYERERLIGLQMTELSAENPALVSERIARALDRRAEFFEGRHKRADGAEAEVEIYTGPIVSAGKTYLFSIVHDVSARIRAETELRRSLKEKDNLLRELHHRVKNNLQIISSMLNLQMGSQAGKAVQGEFLKAQQRIYALALLHEMLYKTENFDRLDLGAYLEAVVSAVLESFGPGREGILYEIEAEPIELGIERAIPCGLITNELVTNAVKHAFAGSGRGQIKLEVKRVAEGRISLSVRDDGDAGASLSGAAQGEGGGIGLKLVEALAEQLGGSMRREHGQGTLVELIFPER